MCLRIAWAYDDDDPCGRHGEPAKDVRDHAPKKILSALRLHKVVRLGTDDGVGGLDVVEWSVERPLVLGDELECGRVVAVPLNGRGQGQALLPERKLVRAHGPVVHGGVDERLGRGDVPAQSRDAVGVHTRVQVGLLPGSCLKRVVTDSTKKPKLMVAQWSLHTARAE